MVSLFFVYRGNSKDNWLEISLFHRSVERVRLSIGAGFHLGDTNGGHNDRLPSFPNAAPCSKSI